MTDQHLNQPREADGRFGAMAHSEPIVRLFDRSDGSFLHPSPSATAEHCIRFWSEIEIPDEIIVQFEKAYLDRNRDDYDKLFTQLMNERNRRWLADNPAPRKERDQLAHEEERKRYLEALVNEVADEAEAKTHPKLISYDVRQLVRAAQMGWHRPAARFDDEGEQVLDHQIELFNGPMTVREANLTYGLESLHWTMEEIKPDNGTDRLVQAIREMKSGISQDLRDVEGELHNQRRDHGYVP